MDHLSQPSDSADKLEFQETQSYLIGPDTSSQFQTMTPYVPNDVGPGHHQSLRAYSIMDSKTEYTYLHQIDRNLEATQNNTGTVYSEDPIMKFIKSSPTVIATLDNKLQCTSFTLRVRPF